MNGMTPPFYVRLHGTHSDSFTFTVHYTIRRPLKGKVFPLQARCGQRVGRGIALLFHDRGTRRGWVVSNTPRLHFTPGKIRHPLYRRLGGSQGRSGRAENLVPTGIRSRTVQPVVSRYTDWATRPTRRPLQDQIDCWICVEKWTSWQY